jgi:renalase
MRVVLIGAGLSGLTAARQLAAGSHDVTVLDKGRGVGGRLATRRIGAATVDHGAQFFTARSSTFMSAVDGWVADGVVVEWCRGFTEPTDGYPRYAVRGGMSALAKHLARGLDVRTSTMAFALRRGEHAPWSVAIDDGSSVDADAVVVTTPVPQALAITITAGIELPDELRSLDYDRTIALLAVLDRPSVVPEPGAVQNGDPVFSMIVDNVRKGVSGAPALTLHANAAWSLEEWDEPRQHVHERLLHEAQRWLGRANVVESEVKRWRFATPQRTWPEPCWSAPDTAGPLVLAGDAFAGPRVEGAWSSGLAAARFVASSTSST